MICFICNGAISGAHLCYGPKNLPHHIHCIPEIILASSEMVVKAKDVQQFEKQEVDNPDEIIEDSIIGEIDAN